MKEAMSCGKNWVKTKQGGCKPGLNHPYTLSVNIIKKKGFIGVEGGFMGEYATNFYNEQGEVMRVIYEPWADEEIIDELKGN